MTCASRSAAGSIQANCTPVVDGCLRHVQVHLSPGALTAASSWFRVTGSTEDTDPCVCAGQDVEIALAARDGYGNAVAGLEPDAVKAVATGNEACVRFEPQEVRAYLT